MPYSVIPVQLDLPTSLKHQCWLHTSRDGHLIGIIAFEGDAPELNWYDLEYLRRRSDEFSVMAFPEYISALIIDLRHLEARLEADVPIFPWRLTEDDCPIRVLVSDEQRAYYSSVFEPAWLAWDLQATLKDMRDFFDMRFH
ncbi:MAG: hypothetical protein EOO69_13015 [Moraxellaceae bacterium]|nr:MAG: hypothetical protein EOO69_13015 [Moraxellaceae bacterium]